MKSPWLILLVVFALSSAAQAEEINQSTRYFYTFDSYPAAGEQGPAYLDGWLTEAQCDTSIENHTAQACTITQHVWGYRALGSGEFYLPDTDTDEDGIPDWEEIEDGTDPEDPDDPGDPEPVDTDGDGVSDADEATNGTDPNSPHSDDDGYTDGQEAVAGTDPLDGDSVPDPLVHGGPNDADSDGFPDLLEEALGSDPNYPSDGEHYTFPNEKFVNDTVGPMYVEVIVPYENGQDGFLLVDSATIMPGEEFIFGDYGIWPVGTGMKLNYNTIETQGSVDFVPANPGIAPWIGPHNSGFELGGGLFGDGWLGDGISSIVDSIFGPDEERPEGYQPDGVGFEFYDPIGSDNWGTVLPQSPTNNTVGGASGPVGGTTNPVTGAPGSGSAGGSSGAGDYNVTYVTNISNYGTGGGDSGPGDDFDSAAIVQAINDFHDTFADFSFTSDGSHGDGTMLAANPLGGVAAETLGEFGGMVGGLSGGSVAPVVTLPFSQLHSSFSDPELNFGDADFEAVRVPLRAFLLAGVALLHLVGAARIIGGFL